MPGPEPLVETATILDADLYAAALRPIGRFAVTRPGAFRADLLRARTGQVMLQEVSISQPVLATLTMPPLAVFGFGLRDQTPETWDGVPLAPDQMVAHRPGAEAHLHGQGVPWGSLSLSADVLEERGGTLIGTSPVCVPGGRLMLRPPPEALRHLRRLHGDAAALARRAPEMFRSPEVAGALEDDLLRALTGCLEQGKVQPHGGAARRARVLRRLERLLERYPDRPFHVGQICAAVDVTERTLQRICADSFGMAPQRYFWLRRMNLVHQALRAAAPGTILVADIAARYGFWHLGRFSTDYRRQFGEPPSATLRRAA